MAKSFGASVGEGRRKRNFLAWLFILISFGLIFWLFTQFLWQMYHPGPPSRFFFIRDVPLPAVLPANLIPNARDIPTGQSPLTPGVAVTFDHFDFQTIDPKTKLLFFAHSGPAPDGYTVVDPKFDPDKDGPIDGYVAVFDTVSNKLVARVNVPQVAGIVAAPDLGVVFAADSNDNIVYEIDEHTLKTTPIPLADNEAPDAIEYDPIDHKVFVSDTGTPPASNPNGNINRDNQNVSVIDLLHNNAVTRINLGHMPKLPFERQSLVPFGYDVGHNHYDPILHREFVITQQLTDQTVAVPAIPPGGTGELVSIDPVTLKIGTRLQLPTTCGTPHGMNIDMDEQIAFIACTDVDPTQNLVENLVRVDLRTLTVIHDPIQFLASGTDIVILDHPLHLLFVASSEGITVFDESNRSIRRLGIYIVGKDTHTLSVDEATQTIYLPMPNIGGRPVLRIDRYNPSGV